MRKRWYVLAVAAGGLTAAAVWFWPVSPLWRSPPQAGRLWGFSPDGRIVVTSLVPLVQHLPPVVSRWDAETGKLLSRAVMPCKYPTRIKEVRPSPDGRLALVGEGFNLDPLGQRADFETGEWFLHDGVSGERRSGPMPDVAFVPVQPFSPDGRLFRGMRDDPQPWSGPSSFYFSATGKLAFALRHSDDLRAGTGLFAQDGETLAIIWWSRAEKTHAVQIIELPSGKERRWFDLPLGREANLRKWDGRYLAALLREPNGPQDSAAWRTFTFDLSQDVPEAVEDPMLAPGPDKRGPFAWFAGEDWVAYFTFVPRTESSGGRPGWWEKFRGWLGYGGSPSRSGIVVVRVADRTTGKTRYDLRQPLGHPCFMTTDGRRLVCQGVDDSVEVWEMDPPLRWPKALAAGTAVALTVLGLGRWRSTRSPGAEKPRKQLLFKRGGSRI